MTDPIRVHAAAPGFEAELQHELGDRGEPLAADLFASRSEDVMHWAQCTWLAPRILPIASIGDAARQLRQIQRNWHLHPTDHVRRARLIEEKLPHFVGRTLTFPELAPTAPIGAWTLLDRDHLLMSAAIDRPFPAGVARFVENRDDPPSRAYLKLWEAFTLLGRHPTPGERCLDLGASPGGWTWVCATLGASVISIDKAPLDERVTALPNVECRVESAFAQDPASFQTLDWVLSDVICYPQRLLRLVRAFVDAGVGQRFVCTLKFQGDTDWEAVRGFASIEGSRLLHLSHNKHELTWLFLRED